MDIQNNKILICNCEKTMKIDGDALSKACSSETTCNVNHNLCGSELNVVLDQLKETQISNKNLLIACTQEQKTFDQIAEENNFETPKTFNIREYAGWKKRVRSQYLK